MRLVDRSDCRDLLLIAFARLWPGAIASSAGPGPIARLLGDFARFRCPAKRRIVAAGIGAALGGARPAAEIARYTREVFHDTWADGELFWAESFTRSPAHWTAACARLRVQGLHHLEDALARRRGVILWESRFGLRSLPKFALIARGYRLTQVYGATHGGSETWVGQHVVRGRYRRAARAIYEEVVDIQDGSLAYLRHLAQRLRDNAVVCVMSTGRLGQKFAPVEILGTSRGLATGAISLARTTGAALIPLFCFRESVGTCRLVLEAPMALPSDGGEAQLRDVATVYARLLESYVLRNPGQWRYWVPRRPSPAPAGDPAVPVTSE